MILTIFTPTYNRAYTLKRLYCSLLKQTKIDFEWILYDDGSTDNTEVVVKEWLNNGLFPVTYIYSKNGGKHRAVNFGLSIAQGKLFFIVDSDDYLPEDAVEKIVAIERSIPVSSKKKFIGICGQRGFSPSFPNGTTFEGSVLDVSSLQAERYGISGDKAEVFYTDLFKKYPFPVFEGENFLTERVVWDRMAHDGYILRYFNSIIYLGDYLADGLTKNYYSVYSRNPKGYGLFISQKIKFGVIGRKEKKKELYIYYLNTRKVISTSVMAQYLNITYLAFLWNISLQFIKVYTIKLLVKIKHFLRI